jgi:cytidylate kinase
MKDAPATIPNIRMITVSGRIASGSTTLGHKLAKILGWHHVEGGEVFWETVRTKLGLAEKDTNLRPDKEDEDFDESLKQILTRGKDMIIETKLAGFNAQGVKGVYKILVICEDERGNDKADIRIDRLINREKVSIEEAKEEVIEREKNDLNKWRKLYADGNPNWNYWDKKYYDLVINTYSHNQDETLKITLEKIGFKPQV